MINYKKNIIKTYSQCRQIYLYIYTRHKSCRWNRKNEWWKRIFNNNYLFECI